MFAEAVKSPTLAATLWPERTRAIARSVALVIAGSLLITLSAKVQVPFFPVPMTLQTLAVLLIGAVLGPRLGAAAVATYLAQGLLGLPVFTNTPPLAAGPLYLLGPTGGFLAGFLVAAVIAGLAAERGFDRSPLRFFGAILVADSAILLAGFAWLATFAVLPSGAIGIGAERAFAAGVQPFLLGELVKVALVAVMVPAMWSLVRRLRG